MGHSLTTSNAAPPVTPHRLIWSFLLWEPQIFKMATRGSENGQRGVERCPTIGFWMLPSIFTKQVSWSEHPFHEKSRRRRKNTNRLTAKRLCQKIVISFIVATNVFTSWPPERQPTGTPNARANFWDLQFFSHKFLNSKFCWIRILKKQ